MDNIRKEIVKLINAIKEHSESIGANKTVSQSELEQLQDKIRQLHEKVIVFGYLNAVPQQVETIPLEKPEVLKTEPVKPAAVDLFGETPPLTEKPKPEKKAEKPAPSKIQTPPITDLKSAIGINDQFQFANELFESNIQEYSIAIQHLNTSESLESAMFYFESLQQLYNWDADNQTVKRLLDLVDRRYSA